MDTWIEHSESGSLNSEVMFAHLTATPAARQQEYVNSNISAQVLNKEYTAYPPPKPAGTIRRKISKAIAKANLGSLIARRTSPRLSEQKNGYRYVQLEDTPRKRRKKTLSATEAASLVSKLDTAVNQIVENRSNVLPVQLMQEAGEHLCQVPPEEMTAGKLQETQVYNEEHQQ